MASVQIGHPAHAKSSRSGLLGVPRRIPKSLVVFAAGIANVTAMNRLTVDRHGTEPSYRQLAALLRARITSGQIRPRDPLPSIAQLAEETGLARGTVRKAVGVLVDEGIAYSVPGRGTFAGPRGGSG